MLIPRPKILVVDDDRDLKKIINTALPKRKFDVYAVSNGKEAWDMVKNLHPDIVLLDVMMPGLDGYETCKRIRDNPQTRNIPVIILTSRVQLKDKLVGIESGADDYITKPFDPLELQARIEMHFRRYLRDMDMSPITALPGNNAIADALASIIESGRKFALLYADIDDFKAYNDYYGFIAGSKVIKMTGGVLTEALRKFGDENDFLGHVGGDDFILLTSIETSEDVSREIIRLFDERIREHYLSEDLEKCYVITTDRRGYVMKFPILTISISIIHNKYRQFSDSIQIGKIAAELKKYAKDLDGSVYVFDRRKS